MTASSRLTQSQRQTMGFRQIQAVNLLCLSNEALAADLTRRAAANPFLRLRLPATPLPTHRDEVEDRGGGLYAHVLKQLPLVGAARADPALAIALVEALDDNGWLDRPLPEIAREVGCQPRCAEAMLSALQQGIEPTGLFARDLADCLRLQAIERGQHSPTMQQVLQRLPLLADGGAAALVAATGLEPDEVALCLARLRRMDPRPGLVFGGDAAPLREPDVIVTRGDAGWQVGLNRATLPVLSLIPSGHAAAWMRPIRAEAEWLATMVERRNRTVLAVSRTVLLRQTGFLDHGPGALLVLSRTRIAAGLGLHDSTVGRVARDLLVDTPHGLRSLCSLFGGGPPGAGMADGQSRAAPSATAIRHRLAQLVAAENPCAPLGDSDLAAVLAAEGKTLARRTVAKYREELGIPIRSRRRQRA